MKCFYKYNYFDYISSFTRLCYSITVLDQLLIIVKFLHESKLMTYLFEFYKTLECRVYPFFKLSTKGFKLLLGFLYCNDYCSTLDLSLKVFDSYNFKMKSNWYNFLPR